MEKASKLSTTPSSAAEVTTDWLSSILGYKLDPSSLNITPNAHEGKGFLSNLLRITCKKETNQEEVNLIVKFIPENEQMQDIVVTHNLDKMELLAYQTVIPALIAQLPELSKYICPFVYGSYTEPGAGVHSSVIVLEDLKPLGYFPLDFGDDLNQSQIDEIIDFLVKLHFAGSVLEELEGKSLDKVYPLLGHGVDGVIELSKPLVRESYPRVLQLLSNSSAEVQEAYGTLDGSWDEIIVGVFAKSLECRSLIHGDLWTNNILYNSDTSRHTKVIDWQIMTYRDATLDLAVFLISSLPTSQITRNGVENLVQKYHNSFHKLSTERSMPHLVQRNWEDFLNFFNTYGLGFALIWFVMSIAGIAGKNDERLIRIYEYFHEVGVLSVLQNIQ